MKIIEPGHVYDLDNLDPIGQVTRLTFVNRDGLHADPHTGTQSQEVIRALIDRAQYVDQQLPCEANKHAVQHLRMALVWLEARALVRKVEKGKLCPELVAVSAIDGHFLFELKK